MAPSGSALPVVNIIYSLVYGVSQHMQFISLGKPSSAGRSVACGCFMWIILTLLFGEGNTLSPDLFWLVAHGVVVLGVQGYKDTLEEKPGIACICAFFGVSVYLVALEWIGHITQSEHLTAVSTHGAAILQDGSVMLQGNSSKQPTVVLSEVVSSMPSINTATFINLTIRDLQRGLNLLLGMLLQIYISKTDVSVQMSGQADFHRENHARDVPASLGVRMSDVQRSLTTQPCDSNVEQRCHATDVPTPLGVNALRSRSRSSDKDTTFKIDRAGPDHRACREDAPIIRGVNTLGLQRSWEVRKTNFIAEEDLDDGQQHREEDSPAAFGMTTSGRQRGSMAQRGNFKHESDQDDILPQSREEDAPIALGINTLGLQRGFSVKKTSFISEDDEVVSPQHSRGDDTPTAPATMALGLQRSLTLRKANFNAEEEREEQVATNHRMQAEEASRPPGMTTQERQQTSTIASSKVDQLDILHQSSAEDAPSCHGVTALGLQRSLKLETGSYKGEYCEEDSEECLQRSTSGNRLSVPHETLMGRSIDSKRPEITRMKLGAGAKTCDQSGKNCGQSSKMQSLFGLQRVSVLERVTLGTS